jgi:hypothetical protein
MSATVTNSQLHQILVMASNTIPTRVMIVSDTHEHSFDGTNMPLVDTGDLTNSANWIR